MTRMLTVTVAACWALWATAGVAHDLMPPHVLQQLGLTQAWARPMQVPYGAQTIADQQLFAHQANPHEFVEIVLAAPAAAAAPAPAAAPDSTGAAPAAPPATVLARISTQQLGTNGQPIGRAEAERLAANQIRRLKRRGIEASINVSQVPRVHLYTLSSDGSLECRDAESGEPIWSVLVGDRRLPYGAIGVSEEFLTVINGANLYKVEAATGEVMEQVRMSGAPSFGAVNAGEFSMIPMIGGGIEGYPLRDPTRDPFLEIVEGSALAMPTKAPGQSSRTAWGTDRGFVYVMELEGTPSVLFRLKTDGIVSGRIAAASGERFFFGSESGQVYGLRATRSGEVLWSQPWGEPFYNQPLIVEDQLLIRSTYGNLYALDVADGTMTWDRAIPNIGDLIAAFGGRAYVTTLTGGMAVIDLQSGELIANYREVLPVGSLDNQLTNRIYLVSESGDVQCVRPEGAELPTFLVQPVAEAAEPATEAKPQADAGQADPFGAGGADPFGAGGADPFGGGDAGQDAMDPAADPFGGGDAGPAMEDPFGGDPFGAGQ
jgi:outer membrane protein assembly factor BamB